MRLFHLAAGRAIEQHRSEQAAVLPLAAPITRAQLVTITLEPGGVLGRHEAVARQLLVVVTGSGVVTGGDDVPVPIKEGMAALWDAGELHETRAGEFGLRAMVLEGEFEVVVGR